MTDAQKQNIRDMRLRGMGYKRIAGSLDLSENTVKSFCKRNKLGSVTLHPISATGGDEGAICKQCGKPLERKPKKKSKTFCNNKCRYDYWNASPEQRKSAHHTVCAGCGVVFTSAGSNRKYCGHPCYIASRFSKGGNTCDKRTI